MAKRAGLRQLYADPLKIDSIRVEHRSALFRRLVGFYALLTRAPVFRSVLTLAGPVFQSMFVKEKTK